MEKTYFVLDQAPEGFSVLSANASDLAEVEIRGHFIEDTEDDTFLPLDFSKEALYLYVTSEESGAPACQPVHLSLEGDAFVCTLSIPVGGPYVMGISLYNEEKRYYELLHGA